MNEEEFTASHIRKGAVTSKNITPLKERFSQVGSTKLKN